MVLVVFIVTTIIIFKFFSYPNIWLIQSYFDYDANKTNKALQPFVPDHIRTIADIQYDENDTDAFLDVYYPENLLDSTQRLPTIVWTHGGGFISGDKSQISNYCKILASKGYTVIAVNYTIAPHKKYPTPILQLNKALSFILANAESLTVDTDFIFLAGDSAGSMIAASVANMITNPEYATLLQVQPGIDPNQLKGLLLFCGVYDMNALSTDGLLGHFIKNVQLAYFGTSDIANDYLAETSSVAKHLTTDFPNTFISAGNKDPLLQQSKQLAAQLSKLNVPIDTLFYPNDEDLNLGHEYQFKLDSYGKAALDRSIEFLELLQKNKYE